MVHIVNTPALDWLLLTKRPQAMRRLLPADVAALPNVWPGVTVESSDYTWRIDELLKVKAAGPRWISYEPALSFVNFAPWVSSVYVERPLIHWILVGGESGPGYRPMDLTWVDQTVTLGQACGVSVFVKQDSGPKPGQQGRIPDALWVHEFPSPKGA